MRLSIQQGTQKQDVQFQPRCLWGCVIDSFFFFALRQLLFWELNPNNVIFFNKGDDSVKRFPCSDLKQLYTHESKLLCEAPQCDLMSVFTYYATFKNILPVF